MGKLSEHPILLIAMALIAGSMFASCKPDEPDVPKTISVTGVSLGKTSISLEEGGSETLTATVSPDNATNKAVSWKSSDTGVATVDNTGKVTAVKAGSATITVTTSDGSKTASCSVTVAAKAIPVTGITIDETAVTMVAGESKKLNATVAPDNATDKKVTWTTSDSAVATVDGDGNVTAVAAGSATITAKAGDKTATCPVTVTPKDVKLESIAVDPATKQVKEGETFDLSVKFLPEGAEAKPVSWRSTNDQVAIVEGGTVTALKEGKTKIFARVDDTEIEAFCDVTVLQDPTLRGIAFNTDRYGIAIGDPKKLELLFTPSYASNKNVTFSSSDPSIATVNADGIVNGLAQGEVTITAKSAEGGFEATCKVIVTSSAVKGLYWTQNSELMLGGVGTGIRTIFTPGVDPEGNMYYAHYNNHGYPAINKNGADIHIISYEGWPKGSKSTAGGGYFFVPIELDYRKNLSVLRISDSGKEEIFSVHEGKASYEYEVHDISADSRGNLYIVGEIKDEYGLYVATMWTLTADGKVSKTTFGDGSRDTSCYAVAAAANDVWCLVWEGYSNIYNGKSILAAYKNGKRQYQLCDQLCRTGGLFCQIGIAGNDVYAVVNNDIGNNNLTTRIEVFKNGKLLYILNYQDDVSISSMFVTPSGDTYVSTNRFTDSESFNYIWKNDTHIFSPTSTAWDLFVKE
ncbi:MAG: Ig domain-containing protein [Bacteroidales bacterium]|nr:Ig domain-containing protein [Bacteroidales bacterium]